MKIQKDFGSIIVVVPHEDDEILMSAGVIRKAVEAGISCNVVMATNGDYECSDYEKGQNRLRESIAGLQVLGLSKEHLEIMGYADTGMPREDSFLTHLYEEVEEEKCYPSSCAQETYGIVEKDEFHKKKWGKHGKYCRRDFKKDLKEILREKKAEHIFTTSQYDTHGDHAALYWFVCEVLDELRNEEGYEPSLYCGLIHSCAGDEVWPLRDTKKFTCPDGLEGQHPWEKRCTLELPEEMKQEKGTDNLKYQALQQHKTALEPDAYEFLMAFIKDEEVFWKMR